MAFSDILREQFSRLLSKFSCRLVYRVYAYTGVYMRLLKHKYDGPCSILITIHEYKCTYRSRNATLSTPVKHAHFGAQISETA